MLLPSTELVMFVPLPTLTVALPAARALKVICMKLNVLDPPAPKVARATRTEPLDALLIIPKSRGEVFSVKLCSCNLLAS